MPVKYDSFNTFISPNLVFFNSFAISITNATLPSFFQIVLILFGIFSISNTFSITLRSQTYSLIVNYQSN